MFRWVTGIGLQIIELSVFKLLNNEKNLAEKKVFSGYYKFQNYLRIKSWAIAYPKPGVSLACQNVFFLFFTSRTLIHLFCLLEFSGIRFQSLDLLILIHSFRWSQRCFQLKGSRVERVCKTNCISSMMKFIYVNISGFINFCAILFFFWDVGLNCC